VVPLSSAYAISEAVGVERSISRRFTEARLFLGLFTVQVLIGAALAMTSVNLITLLIGTQVLQGIVTPVILVFILILTNRRSLLGKAANGPAFRIAATICVVAISAMSLTLLGVTVLGFFGRARLLRYRHLNRAARWDLHQCPRGQPPDIGAKAALRVSRCPANRGCGGYQRNAPLA
jgi:hypothetical protein